MLFCGALQPHKENTDSFLNPASETLPSSNHQRANPPFPGKKKEELCNQPGGQELLLSSSADGTAARWLGLTPGTGRACPAAGKGPAEALSCEQTVTTGLTFDRLTPFTSLVSDHLERT